MLNQCGLARPLSSFSSYRLLMSLALITATMALSPFFPLIAFPQSKPLDDAAIEVLKVRIRDAAQKTQTIAGDFIQEKEMSMIKEKIVSTGKFYFKKEKMLRWEYLQPFTYQIIIINDQISINDENKVNRFNVQSNKIFQEINHIILGSIRGTLVSDEKNFHAVFSDNGTTWVVKLRTLAPKLKESLFEIIIYFDRKNYSVNCLEMIEPGGDCTKINFFDKKLNQPVSDEKFMVP